MEFSSFKKQLIIPKNLDDGNFINNSSVLENSKDLKYDIETLIRTSQETFAYTIQINDNQSSSFKKGISGIIKQKNRDSVLVKLINFWIKDIPNIGTKTIIEILSTRELSEQEESSITVWNINLKFS